LLRVLSHEKHFHYHDGYRVRMNANAILYFEVYWGTAETVERRGQLLSYLRRVALQQQQLHQVLHTLPIRSVLDFKARSTRVLQRSTSMPAN
jgi:hypothetical protein